MTKKKPATVYPPIVLPRWLLTVKYAIFLVLGLSAMVAGIPSFEQTAYDGFSDIWGALLIAGAGVSLVASLRAAWEFIERWSALLVAGLLTAYSAAALSLVHNAAAELVYPRVAFTIVIVCITLLPAVRAGALLATAGKRRAT